MKKIFLLMFCFFTLFITKNVYAENLVMNYAGNPYYVISGNSESHSSIVTYFELDGEVAYCVEPGILVTDFNYLEGDINSLPYSEYQINLIKLIGYYGYEYPNHQTNNYRMATQALIWETLTGKTVNFYTEKYGNGNVINVTNERNEIMHLVNEHNILPNINTNLTLSISNDNVLIDSNNVLNNFEIINNNDDLEVSKNNNSLHIKGNKEGTYTIKLRKKKYDNKKTIFYIPSNGLSQKLIKLRYDDEVELNINIHLVGGKINLSKVDSGTKSNESIGTSSLLNAKYGIYDLNNNLISELITDAYGFANSNLLPFGNYYIKEIIPSYGYLLDNNKYEFSIDVDNLEKNMEVEEDLIKKDITIIKTLEGDISVLDVENDINFEIYFKDSNEFYKTITTNNLGVAKVKLPYGEYVFHQVNSQDGYFKSDDFIVTIDENTSEIYKVIYDKRVRGKISIIKSDLDSNVKLKGAYFEIYKDNVLLYSSYTDENGLIEFNDLEVGSYKIIEKIAPDGYILDNKVYEVNLSNESYELVVEVKNKHEEIIVPNTSLNDNDNLKHTSIGIMILGFIIIIFSKKGKIFK